MNHKEIQAIRKFLMFEISEAADLLGVSERRWECWESNWNDIPEYVEELLEALYNKRLDLMSTIDEALEDHDRPVSLAYYSSFDAFIIDNPDKDKADWRLSQSVAAQYLVELNLPLH